MVTERLDNMKSRFDTPQQPPTTPRAALATVAWLRAVSGETLDRLTEFAVLHRMPPGSMLFEQAETPAFLLCVVSGSVELFGVRGSDETLIELVGPGDLLLPAAVLNRQPYLLRARVLDEAQLVMIQAEAFRRAVASDHALCLAVLACEAAHFRRQVKSAKNIKLRSAEERVGCYFLKIAEQVLPAASFKLTLEKRLIASQLGMTRETFSRTLAGIGQHGLQVEGDTIHIINIDAARARFQLDPLIDGPEAVQPLAVEATTT